MSKKNILKVKDKTDSYYTKMPDDGIWDLPARLLISGKSQLSGKSTTILNLFRGSFYGNHFHGDDIFYITNNKVDNKVKLLQEYKEIPDENIMAFNTDVLTELYDSIEEEFIESVSNNEKPKNKMIVFDDVGYTSDLKKSGILSKLISNGRHLNLSQIYSIQSFKMASTTIRNQITGAILFNTSQSELELISESLNYLETKKQFIKMFRDQTREKHSFLVINFTNKASALYMDKNFEPIDVTKYL